MPQEHAVRDPLPPKGRTALSANSDDPVQSIVLCVQSADERRLLARAFEALKWIVSAHASLWSASQEARTPRAPTIVLIDRADLVPEAQGLFSQADILVLADGTEEAVAKAWESVPDWVITRTIDPSDPLGAPDSNRRA